MPVSTDDALGPESGRSVGRRHIATSLVRGGAVPDVQAAFDRYLGLGAPAYVPAAHVDTSVAIRAVRDGGGVAVMAHPSRGRAAACAPPLAKQGLQGLEVFYAAHEPHDVARYRELAGAHGLVMTAGSDFHEPTAARPRPGVSVAADDIEPFFELVAAR